jgi:hypothetical protein
MICEAQVMMRDEDDDDDDEKEAAAEEEVATTPEPTRIYPGPGETSLIFENTLESAGMRRLLINIWGHDPKRLGAAMEDGEDKWNNTAFLFSIAKRSAQLSPLQPDSEYGSPPCRCHHCMQHVKPTGILLHNYHEVDDEPEIVLDAEKEAAMNVKEPIGDLVESEAEDTDATGAEAEVIETTGTDGIDDEVAETGTTQEDIDDEVMDDEVVDEETVDTELADVVVVDEGVRVEVSEGVEVSPDTASTSKDHGTHVEDSTSEAAGTSDQA